MLKNEYEVETKLTQNLILQGLTQARVERSAAFIKTLRAIYRTLRLNLEETKQDARLKSDFS